MSRIDYVASALDELNITMEVCWKNMDRGTEKNHSNDSLSATNSTWTGLESNSGLVHVVGILVTVLRPQNDLPSFVSAMLSTFPA